MRVKISTNSPLPKINCWIPLTDEYVRHSVHQLRKKICRDLELNVEPSELLLDMEGFRLLPQTIIKDLIRDSDLITVGQDKKSKSLEKKRKASIEPRVEETTNNHGLVLTKQKKSKKDTTTENTAKPKEPKRKEKKTSKAKEKSLEKTTTKVESKEKSKAEKTIIQEESVEPPKKKAKIQTPPFEGKNSTKKRNMRRRLLKQFNKLSTNAENVHQETEIIDMTATDNEESQVLELNIVNNGKQQQPSIQLLKKNKNKKKNHKKLVEDLANQTKVDTYLCALKETAEGSSLMQELYETPPTDTYVQEATEVKVQESKNPYGRAFVTFVESEKNYKGRNNNSKYVPREYPINRVPTLFYADQGLTPEAIDSQKENIALEEETIVEQTAVQGKINYEADYPEADFSDNVPTVGQKLAIKTLELTANYTPEISDWKEVILKEMHDNEITVEFLPGFQKASTKGGKFEFRSKKRNSWYEEYYQEQEQEEEEEIVDSVVTFAKPDIFAIRNMS